MSPSLHHSSKDSHANLASFESSNQTPSHALNHPSKRSPKFTPPQTHASFDSSNHNQASFEKRNMNRLSLGSLTPRSALQQSNPSYENYIDSHMRALFEERLSSMMRTRVDMKDICDKQVGGLSMEYCLGAFVETHCSKEKCGEKR